MQLSVIIITRNEEANIGDCLRSVAFADEVIVLDSASSDRTVDIARSFGAKVFVTQTWPGFGPQKNIALSMVTGNWVLSLDADERITPDLQTEILQSIATGAIDDAFEIPRSSSYCGQFIRYSGWRPDYVLRLFRRGIARFSDDLVHERVLFEGRPSQLKSPLLHLSFSDFESVLDKLNRYSTAGAQNMTRKGDSATLAGAIGHGAWAFLRTYVLQRGFLDGALGLALAISNAQGTYYRHAKRWLMMRKQEFGS